MTPDIEQFFQSQLERWPMARANYEALGNCAIRPTGMDSVMVQFNPARAVSTGAKVDAASIKERPCFLCRRNRPAEQTALRCFPGYELLVNPFPIFRRHFTIAAQKHIPQNIKGRGADLYSMARAMDGYAVFYNGPRCGASAPDHMHFQAVPTDNLPLLGRASFPWFKTVTFASSSPEEARIKLDQAIENIALVPGRTTNPQEPMVNVLAHKTGGNSVRFTIIPRKAHRPEFYGIKKGQMLISPASVDLAGVIITPRREDFDAIDRHIVRRLFSQVCYPEEPRITVGIMEEDDIRYELHGDFRREESASGAITFRPESPDALFTLKDVKIGKGFHWQRRENQTFSGALTILATPDGRKAAINTVPLEEYLKSVISSEMSADASEALLQAHAIGSRSWLLAMLRRHGGKDLHRTFIPGEGHLSCNEIVAWHDREEHALFDVCADDHCQRYQGVTRQTSPAVARAVELTRGKVVTLGTEICDTRFSKCCGGVTEEFETCWEPVHHSYLISKKDAPAGGGRNFCDTNDPAIIGQILNSYDREQPGFYRWEEILTAKDLPGLLLRKTGVDFGTVTTLTPLERGKSGRITRLYIGGTHASLILGKELEIRLALSESCLRSSAFDVEPLPDGAGFRLKGRGWGHGVGMCQIGAAVMGAQGYTPEQIIAHYFPGTTITKLYD